MQQKSPETSISGLFVQVGNYLLQDLPMARYEAQLYLDNTLNCATEANLNYPG